MRLFCARPYLFIRFMTVPLWLLLAAGVDAQTAAPVYMIGTVAGSGIGGFNGDGGPATGAELYYPNGIAVDAAGNLFIGDFENNRVRKVTPAGIISTVAGNGTHGFSGDGGPATSAELYTPSGVAVDAAGNLFIADTNNCRIRKVTPEGTISTVAGNGTRGYSGDFGPATSAELHFPSGVAVDGAGNLFIGDTNNSRIRKVTPQGTISTVAGSGTAGFKGDGGPATLAELYAPNGVAVDDTGDLFIADTTNSRIRIVTPAGTISTVAGNGSYAFNGDGGPATSAALFSPRWVAVDGLGNLYIADTNNSRIRVVTPAGIIDTVAGDGIAGFSGDGGPAAMAELSAPSGVAVDGAGDLFIADEANNRVRELTGTQSAPPGLVILMTDSGGFMQGQSASYTVVVSNIGSGATSGMVTLTDTIPAGMTLAALSGTGWDCTSDTCTRSDALGPDASYPPVFVIVNVGLNAPSQATNQASVSGGGSVMAAFSDPTTILPAAPPGPTITAVENGASFQAGFAPNAWFTVTGGNLASVAGDTWQNSIVGGVLPVTLDGVSVTVGGQPAYVYFVSPNQINAVAPNVAAGSTTVVVKNSLGTSAPFSSAAQTYSPAFFLWPGGYAVATHQDFSLAVTNGTFAGVTTVAAKPGDVIILWGTGFGPTTPAAPAGVEIPLNSFLTSSPVSVTVGGEPATVYGAALAPGYAALFQVAIQIPATLADGDYPVVATVMGVPSPSSVLIGVASSFSSATGSLRIRISGSTPR
jgi:uncharacterized protein (TIGR03437 family)